MFPSPAKSQLNTALHIYAWPTAALLGLIVLYAPTINDLLAGPWADARNAHGPILLLVASWLLARKVHRNLSLKEDCNWTGPSILLGLGSVMYGLGRGLDIPAIEFGSILPVLTSLLWLTLGVRIVKAAWFPLMLITLAAPLPASAVEFVTHPMKLGASVVADQLLHVLGYPVARDGVILAIGQYRLLVADACAGLKSLFVLEALGLVYINLMGYTARWRNITLAVCVVPIAFIANAARIVLLAIITFHWGDAAAQGFLHDFSGLFLFMVALFSIFSIDSLLGRFAKSSSTNRGQNVPNNVSNKTTTRELLEKFVPHRFSWLVWPVCVIISIFQAHLLSPNSHYQKTEPNLTVLFPQQVGEWVQIDSPFVQMSLSSDPNSTDQPYDQQWTGTYKNRQGQQLMVAAAYVHRQTQDIKLHQPEVCYTAQGFAVGQRFNGGLSLRSEHQAALANKQVPVQRFTAASPERQEWVSYWMRSGAHYANTGLEMRKAIVLEGLKGNTVDGMLLRVSSLSQPNTDPKPAFENHDEFMRALIQTLTPEQRHFLIAESSW